MKSTILIVDDNKSVLTALQMLIQTEFETVITLSNPNQIQSIISKNSVDVVLLDMNFKAGINTGNEGLYWLHKILSYAPSVSVVMITAYGDIELSVKAVKEGAFDFILKPWNNDKLIATLHAALKLRKSKTETDKLRKTTGILKRELNADIPLLIGESEAIKKVMTMVKKVAVTDANILITGENGTGKELIAREIHNYSNRKNEILVSVDMGAISETLFESELFGHTKGAFTDAIEERTGKFETAESGTLFLDEIGNLPLSLQAKMLRALQTRTITKLGDNTPVSIDIRIISATNKNLQTMVFQGLFREDLLYRINTITIDIPPLRERNNDILLLADYFLKKFADKYNKPGLSITRSAYNKLLKYHWPGNVRELQHCMEKAVILAEDKVLNKENFTLNTTGQYKKTAIPFETLEEMEKQMIITTLKKEKGNMSLAAKKLGITRQTLYNKLNKYGI